MSLDNYPAIRRITDDSEPESLTLPYALVLPFGGSTHGTGWLLKKAGLVAMSRRLPQVVLTKGLVRNPTGTLARVARDLGVAFSGCPDGESLVVYLGGDAMHPYASPEDRVAGLRARDALQNDLERTLPAAELIVDWAPSGWGTNIVYEGARKQIVVHRLQYRRGNCIHRRCSAYSFGSEDDNRSDDFLDGLDDLLRDLP